MVKNRNRLHTAGGDSIAISGELPDEPSPRFTDPPPLEVVKAAASGRFFTSPAPARSIIEEARLSAAGQSTLAGFSVPVATESSDPYGEFWVSMLEMVEARRRRQPVDWDFMEELLLYYLELNERSVHKYILRAFADLISGSWPPSPVEKKRMEL
ncbi:hypothetical protein AXF42_Ash011311 [Apostasia shenzhenica]|uniref:Transcription repressor n=1 Tax=Apostasia shenzhenica TaxID=1088818 RepID=A0A2I0AE62_9ASPA|nr:hypothetical protein AXF42_Ash011311 [Apostasia shenzhenica]